MVRRAAGSQSGSVMASRPTARKRTSDSSSAPPFRLVSHSWVSCEGPISGFNREHHGGRCRLKDKDSAQIFLPRQVVNQTVRSLLTNPMATTFKPRTSPADRPTQPSVSLKAGSKKGIAKQPCSDALPRSARRSSPQGPLHRSCFLSTRRGSYRLERPAQPPRPGRGRQAWSRYSRGACRRSSRSDGANRRFRG